MVRKNIDKNSEIMQDIDLMEQLEYYHKPRKKKRIDQRILIGVAVILVVIIALLLVNVRSCLLREILFLRFLRKIKKY